ncbi:MAG: ABC-F family ATP-binding cassette domain-containing protein [Treponema sp.]|uniref:ABC-F family ATP-binding cassette domain-containing protein n=1 Tax=Treponema sp. TaxID=166 RepID=UPI001DEA418C|nr:ABC-F family ATP-binding cassette domain-containing protein [Treponema sp.]MBS7240760.1 ABC-F family ATP-binding cassette domain-containing protein [Treponema sp.]
MINVTDVSLKFSEKPLFKDVNIKFLKGNCYGIIGANGAGKSTFLKLLSGELERDTGDISITPGERLAVLSQDHFKYDEYSVKETVKMGYPKLYQLEKDIDAIYAKEDFSDEDGMKAAEMQAEFGELGGYEAENQIEQMLSGLGLEEENHDKMMSDLDESQKVRVLLAQALFGNPDYLILDEPTNGLDLESIAWLENFLLEFENCVIVVSHDRHFLNAVCTYTCDIDFGKITQFTGNYDFWYQMSQILQKQQKDQQKKREDKMADLKQFIQRFASNVSKAGQASSRKKMLEKMQLEELPVTSRKFPYVNFHSERQIGNFVLTAEHLNSKDSEGNVLLNNFEITIHPGEKVAFVGMEHNSISSFFDIISGTKKCEGATVNWGQTTKQTYMGRDNNEYFNNELTITDWLKQYSPDQDDAYVRGFLGRMLFTGDDSLKKVKVLSGGEKVRCMLSKMMLSGANVLILDDPTNHLDLESIESLNEGLVKFPGVVLFSSHDHEFISTIANRIVEITPKGVIDRMMPFDDYLKDEQVKALRKEYYAGTDKKIRF